MFSRFSYLSRRCSSQRRLFSREIENVQDENLQNNEVKVTLEESRRESTKPIIRPIDQRLQIQRLRNNFARSGPGLKSQKNRNDLVAEFFDLSKSVIEGRLTVDELKSSLTLRQLEDQLNFHIDIMSNNQVVNMVASLVRMQFDPSSNILRLLEHEIKFRVNSLTLTQVMKLIKFYNAVESSFEQKQLTDILNNRLRSTLLSNKTPLNELIEVYHHLAEQNGQTNMLSLTEEKMLNLLTDIERDEDDLVSRYLPKTTNYDYGSLCNIFIELASMKRRPTPLLKAATQALHKLPMPKDGPDSPDLITLINTLSSLVSLNYTNRSLVSKLILDLTNKINLEELDLTTQCNLLRTVGNLKWRSDRMLQLYQNYIKNHKNDLRKVDHNLVITFFHVAAQLDYKLDGNGADFYNECMRDLREKLIDRNSRKWLNYVWSLAVLDLANDGHINSVLQDDYVRAIENPLSLQKINHSDIMRLLNLKAIASLDNRTKISSGSILQELAETKMQRGSDMQKFAAKIKEALAGVVESPETLTFEKHTPYGFVVDCALKITNKTVEAIDNQSLDTLLIYHKEAEEDQNTPSSKVALIYVLFDEALASHPNEPVGHKKIISRILEKLGFKTIFLHEIVLNRHKISADLSKKITEMILDNAIQTN